MESKNEFFATMSFSEKSKFWNLIKDEFDSSKRPQLFSVKGELWKYELATGKLSLVIKPFQAFEYFFGVDGGIYYSIPDAAGSIQLKHFNGSENIIMVYLPKFFELEEETAQILRFNQQSPSRFTSESQSINWEEFLENLSAQNSVQLTDEQQGAVVNGLKHKISILTGGPGTGKTQILSARVGKILIETLFSEFILFSSFLQTLS